MATPTCHDSNTTGSFPHTRNTDVDNSVGNSVDSARAYPLDEVTITAYRLPQQQSLSSFPIRIFSSPELRTLNGTSVADVLERVEGVSVRNYGSVSSLKTVSQRGLGPEHTLVLLNGRRVSSLQNGLTDLSTFSMEDVAQVEILKGGQSALFGADAMSGVVNIVTPSARAITHPRASVAIGSFGYRRFHASSGFSAGVFGIQGSVQQESGEDDFPFRFSNSTGTYTLTRRNADMMNHSVMLNASATLAHGTDISVFARGISSERGVPGTVVSPYSNPGARQTDRDGVVVLSAHLPLTPAWNVAGIGQVHYAYERYHDPAVVIAGEALDNFFVNTDVRTSAEAHWQGSSRFRALGGVEVTRVVARGSSVAGDHARTSIGVNVAGEYRTSMENEQGTTIAIAPALRCDVGPGGRSQLSPRLGLVATFAPADWGPFAGVRPLLRASVTSSFRTPTFNELFFSGGGGFGNPDLRPERATGLDGGGAVSFSWMGDHMLDISAYLIAVRDRIIWLPAGAGAVHPENIRSVRSVGMESSYRWSPVPGHLTLTATYSRVRAVKTAPDFPGDPNVHTRLIYVPDETASLSVALSPSLPSDVILDPSLDLAWRFEGVRYVSESNDRHLPSYAVVDANVHARLHVAGLTWGLRFEVNNLLDREYQVMLSYPMPGRSFRSTLSVEY